jgi:hypothetical protein
MTILTTTLTREEWEQKRQLAANEGFLLEDDHGEKEFRGVDLAWDYIGTSLTVTIKHVSFADNVIGWGEKHVAEVLSKALGITQ